MTALNSLTRRERQIMAVLFARSESSVRDIQGQLPDLLSPTAIRTFLRILADKGHIKRRKDGRSYLYQGV